MSFKKYIKAVGTGIKGNRELEEQEVIDAVCSIVENKVTPAQVGAFLVGWRTKLETNDELKACIKGIKHVVNRDNYKNTTIILYSDSEYVINSMTKWAATWKKNGWKKYDKKKRGKVEIKNKDLIIELYTLYNTYPIHFNHTKAHGTKPCMKNVKEYKIWYGNYMADKLAVEASNSH